MSSSYMLPRKATYVVKVSKTGRGNRSIGRQIVRREFTDYDEAAIFLDRMEEMYRDEHIVEFDTKFH